MIPENSRQWADRVARCATSCAATIETRKIKANEVPLVIGVLVQGLADHVGIPVEIVLELVKQAAVAKELPEMPPQIEVPPHLFPDLLKRQNDRIAELEEKLAEKLTKLPEKPPGACPGMSPPTPEHRPHYFTIHGDAPNQHHCKCGAIWIERISLELMEPSQAASVMDPPNMPIEEGDL